MPPLRTPGPGGFNSSSAASTSSLVHPADRTRGRAHLFERDPKSCKFAPEKCQSGRMGLTRNQVYPHGYRGFESLLFSTAPKRKNESAHHRPRPGAGFFAPCRIRRAAARAEQKGRKRARAAQRLARCTGGVRMRPDLGADASPLRGWRAQLALPRIDFVTNLSVFLSRITELNRPLFCQPTSQFLR